MIKWEKEIILKLFYNYCFDQIFWVNCVCKPKFWNREKKKLGNQEFANTQILKYISSLKYYHMFSIPKFYHTIKITQISNSFLPASNNIKFQQTIKYISSFSKD